jgi:pyruvate formate lyase activating enzyme
MSLLDRRQFIWAAAACVGAAATCRAGWRLFAPDDSASTDIRGTITQHDAPSAPWRWATPARHIHPLGDGVILCTLCPNRCRLAPGDRSVCRSRVNIGGTLYSLAYGSACSANIDPVEKKPLFHFLPGSRAFSIAAAGCNFRCLNCQNWEISQTRPEDVRHMELFPRQVVDTAAAGGSPSIAYTYSEPTTFFEYMIDTARIARARGIKNLWISNGFINPEPLKELCAVLDGANVNLKSISDDIYRTLNGGRLQPVLDTFITLHRQGVHFEMTHLVVPGYGDRDELIRRMCGWILANLGPGHPLHLLRFFPRYRLDRLAPTPVETLVRFRELALAEGIHYVYLGNVPGDVGCHTFCHGCGQQLIERQGYNVIVRGLVGGKCRHCGAVIPGVWSPETDTSTG